MVISARVIQDRRFTTALRGYDREEVIAFLAEVAAGVDSLEERLAVATAKAAKAREQLETLNDVLERHVEETHAARAAILDEAKREAAEIVAAARRTRDGTAGAGRTAETIIAEAERRAAEVCANADELVARAEESAAEIVRTAEEKAAVRMAEAGRLLDEARGAARRIRLETERERAETLAHLTQLRSLLADAEPRALAAARVILTDGEQVVIDLTEGAIEPSPSVAT